MLCSVSVQCEDPQSKDQDDADNDDGSYAGQDLRQHRQRRIDGTLGSLLRLSDICTSFVLVGSREQFWLVFRRHALIGNCCNLVSKFHGAIESTRLSDCDVALLALFDAAQRIERINFEAGCCVTRLLDGLLRLGQTCNFHLLLFRAPGWHFIDT